MNSSVLLSRVFGAKSCYRALVCLMLGASLAFSGVALAQDAGKKSGSSMKAKSGKSSKGMSYVAVDIDTLVGMKTTKTLAADEKEVKWPLGFRLGAGYSHGLKGFNLFGGAGVVLYQNKVANKDADDKLQKVTPTGFFVKLGGNASVHKKVNVGGNLSYTYLQKLVGAKTYKGMYAGGELVVSGEVYKNLSLNFGGGMNFWNKKPAETDVTKLKENEVVVYPPKFYLLAGFHLNVYQL